METMNEDPITLTAVDPAVDPTVGKSSKTVGGSRNASTIESLKTVVPPSIMTPTRELLCQQALGVRQTIDADETRAASEAMWSQDSKTHLSPAAKFLPVSVIKNPAEAGPMLGMIDESCATPAEHPNTRQGP